MDAFQGRIDYLKQTLGRPWPRRLLWIWGVVATWDTFVSQFIPEEIAKSLPKVSWTYGWLPIWAWVLIGALIVVVSSIEFGLHYKLRYDSLSDGSNIHPGPIVPTWLVVSLVVIIMTTGLGYIGYLGFHLSDDLRIVDYARVEAIGERVVPTPAGEPDHFAVNIGTVNSSKQAKITNQRFNYSWLTSASVSEAGKGDLDVAMSNLIRRTRDTRTTTSTSEIEPSAKRVFSAYGEKSWYDRNVRGEGSLYLLVVFEYKDQFIHKE
jgi:hypothetical protein